MKVTNERLRAMAKTALEIRNAMEGEVMHLCTRNDTRSNIALRRIGRLGTYRASFMWSFMTKKLQARKRLRRCMPTTEPEYRWAVSATEYLVLAAERLRLHDDDVDAAMDLRNFVHDMSRQYMTEDDFRRQLRISVEEVHPVRDE